MPGTLLGFKQTLGTFGHPRENSDVGHALRGDVYWCGKTVNSGRGLRVLVPQNTGLLVPLKYDLIATLKQETQRDINLNIII